MRSGPKAEGRKEAGERPGRVVRFNVAVGSSSTYLRTILTYVQFPPPPRPTRRRAPVPPRPPPAGVTVHHCAIATGSRIALSFPRSHLETSICSDCQLGPLETTPLVSLEKKQRSHQNARNFRKSSSEAINVLIVALRLVRILTIVPSAASLRVGKAVTIISI